jgi:hypothetical protein
VVQTESDNHRWQSNQRSESSVKSCTGERLDAAFCKGGLFRFCGSGALLVKEAVRFFRRTIVEDSWSVGWEGEDTSERKTDFALDFWSDAVFATAVAAAAADEALYCPVMSRSAARSTL